MDTTKSLGQGVLDSAARSKLERAVTQSFGNGWAYIRDEAKNAQEDALAITSGNRR